MTLKRRSFLSLIFITKSNQNVSKYIPNKVAIFKKVVKSTRKPNPTTDPQGMIGLN